MDRLDLLTTWMFRALSLTALCVVGLLAFKIGQAVPPAPSPRGIETIYVVNRDTSDISNATIRRDIPAWEQAGNQDFAPVWRTEQVRIKLVDKVPTGGIEALFVKNGPIQGALAYHTVTPGGVPQIVVYSGVANFYGYSNSVSFTHELFELLADPTTQQFNVPYNASPYIHVGSQLIPMPLGATWINESCDPVEADSYQVDGVQISDFITPNWFGDQVSGGYDFMGLVHEPFTVLKGGYASLLIGDEWYQVTNFRHAGRDASGFLKGEKAARS